jgi:hypothetical protein
MAGRKRLFSPRNAPSEHKEYVVFQQIGFREAEPSGSGISVPFGVVGSGLAGEFRTW